MDGFCFQTWDQHVCLVGLHCWHFIIQFNISLLSITFHGMESHLLHLAYKYLTKQIKKMQKWKLLKHYLIITTMIIITVTFKCCRAACTLVRLSWLSPFLLEANCKNPVTKKGRAEQHMPNITLKLSGNTFIYSTDSCSDLAKSLSLLQHFLILYWPVRPTHQ